MSDSKNNSGYSNSGYYNSGNFNSGDYNSGYRNSGYCNSGNFNSGYCNSGDYNSGNHNSGHFNTNEPTVRMFNKDTGKKRSEISLPHINLKLTEWIEDPQRYPTEGGYLLKREYKEAWKLWWSEATPEQRKEIEELPNFDSKIFEEITGVDINYKSSVEIQVEGRRIKISRESAIALGLIQE